MFINLFIHFINCLFEFDRELFYFLFLFQGLSMIGLLPAIVHYIELYENRQKIKEKERRKTPIKIDKIPENIARNIIEKDKMGLEKEDIDLLACIISNDNIQKIKRNLGYAELHKDGIETQTNETNYVITCLQELLVRSNKRTVSDGQQTTPPPLLLQTLLWLLIRCEDGEIKLCSLLLPYCEKALDNQFKENESREWNSIEVLDPARNHQQNQRKSSFSPPYIPPSRIPRLPGVDLVFLLRESNR